MPVRTRPSVARLFVVGLVAAAIVRPAAAQSVPAPRVTPTVGVRSIARPRAGFTLTSPDVAAGGMLGDRQVFNGFGCSGQNVSPALAWKGAPAGTKSYAVTVYDPDAPTGSGFWHWVVYNIPASTTALPAGAGDAKGGAAPPGSMQGTTDYGVAGYGGPCPPAGDGAHRYIFTVYALKVEKLDLPATGTAAFVGFNLSANALASSSFTARYGR